MKQYTILILDDEKICHEKIRKIEKGKKVISAFTSIQAIKLIKIHKPDRIYLDHNLRDETDVDSEMRVCEYLIDNSKIYQPLVIIHSMNIPATERMSKTLTRVNIINEQIPYHIIISLFTKEK